MNALHQILLATVLVLHSGDRIVVEGEVQEANGVVTFRSAGVLYSLPASEIASRTDSDAVSNAPASPVRRLRVSSAERDRLLNELAGNRGGTPPAPPPELVLPTDAELAQRKRDEWSWRREARMHEETLRRAKEELQLLEEKVARLEDEIRTLTNRGFKPRQFTWQTTQLAYTIELIPAARLEVTRAERALAQFREDARRLGVLPGWLR